MDIKLDKWFRCQVDKKILKELSKKSDFKGLQHVSVFFGLLILTGLLAYIFWESIWGIFWILIYGNIYCFANPLWHETGHKTAFKSNYLNEFFYYISCYMACFEPVRWRYSHFIHHGNTYSTENPYDHEIEYGNDLKKTFPNLLREIIPFGNLIFLNKDITFEIIKHSLGIETKVMKDCIPDKAKKKKYFNFKNICSYMGIFNYFFYLLKFFTTCYVFYLTSFLWQNTA